MFDCVDKLLWAAKLIRKNEILFLASFYFASLSFDISNVSNK